MDHNLLNPEYWRNEVKKGNFITIKDEIEILESGSFDGVEYQVQYKTTFKDQDNIGEWIQFHLESIEHGEAILMIKIVGEELDFRAYCVESDEFFKQGNRQDMLKHEQQFIFEEPENMEEFDFDDSNCIVSLEYAKSFDIAFDNGSISYDIKPQGIMYGEYTEDPNQTLDEPTFGCLVEYISTQETRNTEILIQEIGDNQFGGLIKYFEGSKINVNDLEVI